jgi:hypothetical protein
MMEVTDAAQGKIKAILNKNPGKSVRVVMQGFG